MELGFYFYFLLDDLALNGMTLVLSVDMNVGVSIETHMTCDKPYIFNTKKKKKGDNTTYF